jgi:AraC-like DNA-binding protein
MEDRRPRFEREHDDGLNAWSVAEYAAGPALKGLVHHYTDYWERTGGFSTRRELPIANGVMIFNFAGPLEIVGGDGRAIRLGAGEAFVAGTHLRPALSRSTGEQAGIHVFLPIESVRRLIGVPLGQMTDQVVALDTLLGPTARRLGESLVQAPRAHRAELLDQALHQRLSETKACASQAHALHLLRTRPDLDIIEIARDIGWSRKHLADRVRDAVGIGPRSFRRLLRFHRLTKAIGEAPDWAGLAHDAGYYDQSHLIREFREFAGMTPSDYMARLVPEGGGLIEG